MNGTFDEQKIRFTFDRSWLVLKYDESAGHADIRDMTEAKGVDFMAFLKLPPADKALYFIEIKDFRGHEVANRQRIQGGVLALEVVQKVRDTLAGVIAYGRSRKEPDVWDPYWSALTNPSMAIRIVLWLEHDRWGHRHPRALYRDRRKSELTVLNKRLQQRARWLDARTLVVNMESGLPGVTACNLRGAGGHAQHPE